MKTELNDIGIKIKKNCITGKYWLFYMFSEKFEKLNFLSFITKL